MYPILNPPPPWKFYSTHVELWHGCLQNQAANIRRHGVDPTLGAHTTDFGRGFYTTTVRRQAEEFARKRYVDAAARSTATGGPPPAAPALVWFRVPLTDLAPLQGLSFVLGDHDQDRYWSLVHHCRSSPPPPAAPNDHLYPNPAPGWLGWYDVVCGPVAAFWEQRVAMVGADQFSFHTAPAAAVLTRLIGTPNFREIVLPVPSGGGGTP